MAVFLKLYWSIECIFYSLFSWKWGCKLSAVQMFFFAECHKYVKCAHSMHVMLLHNWWDMYCNESVMECAVHSQNIYTTKITFIFKLKHFIIFFTYKWNVATNITQFTPVVYVSVNVWLLQTESIHRGRQKHFLSVTEIYDKNNSSTGTCYLHSNFYSGILLWYVCHLWILFVNFHPCSCMWTTWSPTVFGLMVMTQLYTNSMPDGQ
jgi:hypothetical protein